MTKERLIQLLENPDETKKEELYEMEQILQQYPFFQSLRIVYLKGLKIHCDPKYEKQLGRTSVAAFDRVYLYNYINKKAHAQEDEKQNVEEKTESQGEGVIEEKCEERQKNNDKERNKEEKKYAKKLQDFVPSGLVDFVGQDLFKRKEENNDNKPQQISQRQTQQHQIKEKEEEKIQDLEPQDKEREEEKENKEILPFEKWVEISEEQTHNPLKNREKQEAIIDRFLSLNPKISSPSKDDLQREDPYRELELDREEIMTETLVNIYMAQGKKKEAVEGCEILIGKFPEKKQYFLDKIQEIENKI